jgi:hypothetical protein
LVRFGDVQTVFEPTGADDELGTAKGGGTKVMQAMKPAAAAPAAPAKPGPAKAAPAPKPAAKPAPKKAAAPPPAQAEQKKGKGCGGSAAVVLLGLATAVYWILV